MQFLLTEKPDKKGLVRLRGEDYHYLVHVRRLKPGAVFQAVLPDFKPTTDTKKNKETITQQVNVIVLSIDKRTLTGSVSLANNTVPTSKISGDSPVIVLPSIILFQALPKGTKMDLIVRQAAELGISEVVPFISERSVPREAEERINRWRRIVKEARQQSGSLIDTQVHAVLSADELFAYWEKLQTDCLSIGGTQEALGLLFSPQAVNVNQLSIPGNEGSLTLNNPLEKGGFHRYLYNKPHLLVLSVGPEGGFSDAEANRFVNAGFKTVSLGDTILRTETAALYGAAAAKIILMERAWWKTTLR